MHYEAAAAFFGRIHEIKGLRKVTARLLVDGTLVETLTAAMARRQEPIYISGLRYNPMLVPEAGYTADLTKRDFVGRVACQPWAVTHQSGYYY